jgi:hypothetical protein
MTYKYLNYGNDVAIFRVRNVPEQGRIQDFKLGGADLKKLRRTERGAKILWVFRVKNHDFTPKNLIFSNFRGGARRVRPPPWIRPCRAWHFAARL